MFEILYIYKKVYKILFLIISVQLKHQEPVALLASPSLLHLHLAQKAGSLHFLRVTVTVVVQVTSNVFFTVLLIPPFPTLPCRPRKSQLNCSESCMLLF